jgi:hypothetical protein
VPAGALVFPSSGSSGAALEAHITDTIDAHQSTAIGQGSHSGDTDLAITAGSVDTGLVELLAAVNSRAFWVLDANPAGVADFAGASALIDAMASGLLSTRQPVLFLRPGTYTWDDSAVFDNCTVIGSRRSDVNIQNLAGNLRLGARSRFENLILTLSNNLQAAGGGSVVREVALAVTGDINVSTTRNVFEHITASSPAKFVISSTDNEVRGFNNSQFEVTGSRNLIEDGIVTSVNGLTDPVLDVSGDYNMIRDVVVDSLSAYNSVTVDLSGDHNTVDGLTLSNYVIPAGGVSGVADTGRQNTILNFVATSIPAPAIAYNGALGATLRNFRIESTGGVISAMAGVDCYGLGIHDGVVLSDDGQAGGFSNSGGVLSNVVFQGGDGSAGAGNQLFYGWGTPRTNSFGLPAQSLVLRDVRMEYGQSNTRTTGGVGTGQPVVFFGGALTTVTTDHGACEVHGLRIQPSSTVVNQHQDSLLVIDSYGGFEGTASTFNDVTIDLGEVQWAASGNGRATIFTSGSARAMIVEIRGGLINPPDDEDPNSQMCVVRNLQVLNIKEPDFGLDARGIVKATGVDFYGIQVEGPSSGSHGTSSFSGETGVQLYNCYSRNVYVGRGVIYKSTAAYVDVFRRSVLDSSLVVCNLSAVSASSLVRMTASGESYPTVKNIRVLMLDGSTGALIDSLGKGRVTDCILELSASISQPVLTASGATVVENCTLSRPNVSAPFIELTNADFFEARSNNFLLGGAGTGTGIQVTTSDDVVLESNRFSRTTGGPYEAIVTDSGSSRVYISNTRVDSNGDTAALLLAGDYGIVTGTTLLGDGAGDALTIEVSGDYNRVNDSVFINADVEGGGSVVDTGLGNIIDGNPSEAIEVVALSALRDVTSGVANDLTGITYDPANRSLVAVGLSATITAALDPETAFASQTADAAYAGDFNAVVWDPTLTAFAAVGTSGEIQTSPTGATWTQRNTGGANLNGIASNGAGTFVAVGNTSTIFSSTALATWTSRTSAGTTSIRDVAFGAGLFVAVGDGGEIQTSPTGVTWTIRTSGTVLDLDRIRYHPLHGFVVIGIGTPLTNRMLYSADGITWHEPGGDFFYAVPLLMDRTISVFGGDPDTAMLGITGAYKGFGTPDYAVDHVVSAMVPAHAIVADRSVWVVGDGGQIFRGPRVK